MIENITREQFEGWLAQFGDDEKVGISQHGILCPFANCLKALHPEYLFVANHNFIFVSYRTAEPLEQRCGRVQTAPWQWQLMVALDTGRGDLQPDIDHRPPGQDITAGTVRKVLEQIKSEPS